MDYKNYILCGLIAFAMIVTVISKPASEDRITADEETQNDQNEEYDYEDSSMSADQAKSTASSPKSTMLPYFDVKIVRRTVKPGGSITLECPVKNFADTNVILWIKEENTIINNLNVLDHSYDVTKQNYSLIIKNATESFAGNYYCEIAPQKVRMQTILKVSNESAPVVRTPPELPQIRTTDTSIQSVGSTATIHHLALTSLLSIVLVSTLLSNLLSHRKCFQSSFTN